MTEALMKSRPRQNRGGDFAVNVVSQGDRLQPALVGMYLASGQTGQKSLLLVVWIFFRIFNV